MHLPVVATAITQSHICMHVASSKVFSVAHLQDVIPTIAGIQYIAMQNTPAKVGITSCRCATENALLEATCIYGSEL